MPGIIGLITRLPRERAEQELCQMAELLRHEDFYVTGTWIDESLGVYAGWVARKGSFSDGMPLRNERGDLTLLFSGEEFPDPYTVARLKERGHDVKSDGAGYLVHVAEEDPSFPAGLNGRFHGLLADQTRETVTLFNDRFGMGRIYYHESNESFYFAAEAKAILAVRPELRRLDHRGLGEFISCGAVLENRTLFDGIKIAPPGSAWVFRNGALTDRRQYFDPRDWESQETLDLETYYSELRDVFTRNLPRYFNGDEKIAMSLTGGLDTRMVMAGHKADPGALPCYTFGSMFREHHDVRVGRRVAKASGQTHEVITASEGFLARFPYYAERSIYLTDGCVDVSRSPDLYVNELARQIAPVRMTGLYGGEILRRVRAFKLEAPEHGLFTGDLARYIEEAKQTYARSAKGHPVTFAAFRQAPWYHYGILDLEQTQLSMRSPFLDNDFVHTVFRAPLDSLASDDVSLRLIKDGNPSLLSIPTDRGFAGKRGRIGRAIVHGVLEFQFKAEYAYDIGMPQWVARADHAFSWCHFERLFLGRHKPTHFRVWYRDQLADYVKQKLLDRHNFVSQYVNGSLLESFVNGHLSGSRNYTNEIHKLLTLELLHELFIESSQRSPVEQHLAAVR
jgi:asparagine synthase (glutamine-hydrolysing)